MPDFHPKMGTFRGYFMDILAYFKVNDIFLSFCYSITRKIWQPSSKASGNQVIIDYSVNFSYRMDSLMYCMNVLYFDAT
jgi:hypothetical protein